MENYNDHKKYYHENGNIISEYYYLYGHLHRTNGPAEIHYYKNGNVNIDAYWLNNERHRSNGPATIFYNENGSVEAELYFLNSEEINVNSLEEFKKYQKALILK